MFPGPQTEGTMLRGNQRSILFFDLAMAPHPSDAPALPLAEFIPYGGGDSELLAGGTRKKGAAS